MESKGVDLKPYREEVASCEAFSTGFVLIAIAITAVAAVAFGLLHHFGVLHFSLLESAAAKWSVIGVGAFVTLSMLAGVIAACKIIKQKT